MRLLSASDIAGVMSMEQWINAMEPAFLAISQGTGAVAERQFMPLLRGTGIVMGAAIPDLGFVSKTVGVMPGNSALGLPGTTASVLLLDPTTAVPLCLLDGSSFTAWRTAALSGYATRLLANPGARRAVLIGCGAQAATQLFALGTRSSLEDITVLGHRPGQAQAFIDQYGAGIEQQLLAGDRPAHALRQADIVITATSSAEPVLEAGWLKAGCHVTAVGSFRPDMIEIDPALMQGAQVFVESRHSAAEESGELLAAERNGWTQRSAWTELGEVIAGQAEGRSTPESVTLFKSVGHALFDLTAARAVYDAAVNDDLGQQWDPRQ
jgi:ornithine cyclodeaminase